MHQLGFGGTDDSRQFVERSLTDALHALELFQQGSLRLLADALHRVEHRSHLSLATLVTMERDGEAVHFVLYTLKEVKEGRALLHADDDRRKPVEQFGSSVAVVLSQAGDGNAEMQFIFDHLAAISRSNLPFERYYHWSFLDNFEWLEGCSARFGLVEVDFATMERRVKKSGRFYSELIKQREVTQELYDEFLAMESYHH